MRTILLAAGLMAFGGWMMVGAVSAHCEIPCGIYDDQMRIKMIAEDIATVEKSIVQIELLSRGKEKDYNQIVRWVINKDNHAEKIQETVWQYFLVQRIKPADTRDSAAYQVYVRQLALLHKMLVLAMKTKQSLEMAHIEELKQTLAQFEKLYFPTPSK